MTRSIVIVAVLCVVSAGCLRAWRDLPSREFPRDGEHAPRLGASFRFRETRTEWVEPPRRSINENRSRR